jgi:hypothetical protein
MIRFSYLVLTRTGQTVAVGTVDANTPAGAKGKVRRLPKVYPMDLIYITQA